MCIAILKPKGIDLPDKSIIQTCFRNNPDGAGFVLNRNGINYIYKGYFTFNGLWNAIKSISPLKEESMMIHCRVATHGKINIENCHPFPITDKFSDMIKPIIVTESDVLVHNGKLSINISNSIYSDSMHFAREINGLDRNKYQDLIEYIIKANDNNKKGNRIGILSCNGDIERYGEGWIENNKILYSNDSYLINGTYQSKKTKFVKISSFDDLKKQDKFYTDGKNKKSKNNIFGIKGLKNGKCCIY